MMQHLNTLVPSLLLLGLVSFSVQSAEHQESSAMTQERIQVLMQSSDRPAKQIARDRYRHPLQTLSFFGVEPDMTVVEIWPGGQGGWYRRILQPLLKDNGAYIPVRSGDEFPAPMDKIPDGSADRVLVFRAHGFMIYKKPVQQYYDAIYKMLKPGGIFGIVDHAGDENIPQDPEGKNGYVNESHALMMAKKAGFKLMAASDVNRNPKDTKNYPKGVWSLPPALSGSFFDREARANYQAIGESDRFTLKFFKSAD